MYRNLIFLSLLIFSVNAFLYSTTNLSEGRSQLASASTEYCILFAGGIEENNNYTANVETYRVLENRWEVTQLSEGRNLLVGTTVGSYVVFAGGYNGTHCSDRVDLWDNYSEEWSTATLAVPRAKLAATTVG